jgi:hypothetical protein
MTMDDLSVAMKAREFITRCGPSALPVLVERYAAEIGGSIKKETLGENEDAWSVRLPTGKYRICVNCAHNSRRQRFSICHEVAHAVLEIPADHAQPSWRYTQRPQGEIFCDTFAAELLLPSKLFRYSARSAALRDARAWIKSGSAIPTSSYSARARAGENPTGPEEAAPEEWFEDWEREGALYEDVLHLDRWDQTLTLLWFEDDEVPPPRPERKQWEERSYGQRELDGTLPWPSGKKRR